MINYEIKFLLAYLNKLGNVKVELTKIKHGGNHQASSDAFYFN